MHVRRYTSLAALPPAYAELFGESGDAGIFRSRGWLENLVAHGIPAGDKLCLFGVEAAGPEARAVALLPGVMSRLYEDHPRARVLHFCQLDGEPFSPFVARAAEVPETALERVIGEIYAADPPYDVVRLSPLDPGSPLFARLVRGLRRTGLIVQTYRHFMNWYEVTEGMSSQDYFRRRPSALRNTLRRKGKQLTEVARGRFELITGDTAVDRGIADYARVFAASWKPPEKLPPRYIAGLMRYCAAAGALRLGFIYVEEEPVATQFWIASAGTATVYRLAYDQRFAKLSVGSILTQRMIEHLVDVDKVAMLDLGIGDDSYKKDWATHCRERRGIAAFNPRTARGLRGALRHLGGQKALGALRQLRRLLRGARQGAPRASP